MNIKHHAVRRYKQRIGGRTASRKRIIRKIHSEIEQNTITKTYNKERGSYKIHTDKFTAVCMFNTVLTITLPERRRTN